MMEVEDRHLNVLVDLINGMLTTCEPLKYLSEQFNPSDMVWRLSQLIVNYENNIFSDSVVIEALQYDHNSNLLSVCSAIKVWLLEYYKSDFVTLNEIKLESGVEEEIVLTALMVLRIMYRMRQLMDQKSSQELAKGWKDLHEFDQQLDEKFETKCLKLMTLLVKHSKNYNLKINSLLKQINCLEEENQNLTEKLRISDEKCVSNQMCVNQTLDNTIPIDFDVKELLPEPANVSPQRSSPSTPPVFTTPKMSIPSPKTPNRSVLSRVRKSIKVLNSPITKSLSPKKQNITTSVSRMPTSPLITRRSPRISNSSSKVNGNTIISPQKAFNEIRDIFNETDESEFEYFDISPTSQPKIESLVLPLKKRKPPIIPPSPEKPTIVSKSKKSLQNGRKSSKSYSWPSRNKVYPRKKRYPCDWPNCGYIADRPSTLVRHARAHTGEKPYKCDWPGCDKRYKMSSNLTPHKLTHTGEKPYKCDWPQCQKQFTYPQHLKRHRIAHQKRARFQRTESTKLLTDASKRIKQELIAITST